MKIKLDGKECFARIVVREEANGRKYFYDGDITEIKKNPAQTGGPDSKNGVQSEGVLFTHSIQEWLVKVKETTDKIGGEWRSPAECCKRLRREQHLSPNGWRICP